MNESRKTRFKGRAGVNVPPDWTEGCNFERWGLLMSDLGNMSYIYSELKCGYCRFIHDDWKRSSNGLRCGKCGKEKLYYKNKSQITIFCKAQQQRQSRQVDAPPSASSDGGSSGSEGE